MKFNVLYGIAMLHIQEKCDINAATGNVHTALHLAADEGNAAIVELLVGHGIDLDVIDERGMTALHIVVATKEVVGIPEDSPELSKVCTILIFPCSNIMYCISTLSSVCTVGPLLVCVQ